jgi:hypothetical protein
MIWASFEHRRFSLDAFAPTEADALALLKKALKKFNRSGESFGMNEDEVQYRTVASGTVLLDGEEYR